MDTRKEEPRVLDLYSGDREKRFDTATKLMESILTEKNIPVARFGDVNIFIPKGKLRPGMDSRGVTTYHAKGTILIPTGYILDPLDLEHTTDNLQLELTLIELFCAQKRPQARGVTPYLSADSTSDLVPMLDFISVKSGIQQSLGLTLYSHKYNDLWGGNLGNYRMDVEFVTTSGVNLPLTEMRFPFGRFFYENPSMRADIYVINNLISAKAFGELPLYTKVDPLTGQALLVLPVDKCYMIPNGITVNPVEIAAIPSRERHIFDQKVRLMEIPPNWNPFSRMQYSIPQTLPLRIPENVTLVIETESNGALNHLPSPLLDPGFGRNGAMAVRFETLSQQVITEILAKVFFTYA